MQLKRSRPDMIAGFRQKLSRDLSKVDVAVSIEIAIDWDPLAFLRQQQYEEKPSDAIQRALTLTGNATDAFASSATAYVHRIWPRTAKSIMFLMARLAELYSPTRSALAPLECDTTLPNNTTVKARLAKQLVVTLGNHEYTAEVIQQLAWLAAALRSSDFPSGLAECTPYLSGLKRVEHTLKGSILFRIIKSTSEKASGKCWHDMFRNPVIVRGFPIPAKQPDLGVELRFEMLSKFAGTDHIVPFNGSTILKGFSTMLVASAIVGDLIVWHYMYNLWGPIYYYDYRGPKVEVNPQQLLDSRHIIGWCSSCHYHAGKWSSVCLIATNAFRCP